MSSDFEFVHKILLKPYFPTEISKLVISYLTQEIHFDYTVLYTGYTSRIKDRLAKLDLDEFEAELVEPGVKRLIYCADQRWTEYGMEDIVDVFNEKKYSKDFHKTIEQITGWQGGYAVFEGDCVNVLSDFVEFLGYCGYNKGDIDLAYYGHPLKIVAVEFDTESE